MKFEWDADKAEANLARHEVSFDEAKTVFDDPLYVDFHDPDHSYDEHRFLIVGVAAGTSIDRVVHRTRRRHPIDQCQGRYPIREKRL